MYSKQTNIIWHCTKVDKEHRQALNGHKSFVLWLTGLSGSGKSTIAVEVEKRLYELRKHSYILDGDNVRHGLNKNLGFSQADRSENIRRMGEVAKLFVDAGMIVLIAVISPYSADRHLVRSLFEEGEFIEIYIKCSIEECSRRDPKGLYRKALQGEIKNFTGISAPYEIPQNPEILVENELQSVNQSVDQIIDYLNKNSYI